MIPPTSIDGTDITGATIDGTDVQEITVDGQTVFELVDDPYASNPLVQYAMDEGSGTTISDTFGNEPDGTDADLSFVTDSDLVGGLGVDFDGSDEITLADPGYLSTPYEITIIITVELDSVSARTLFFTLFPENISLGITNDNSGELGGRAPDQSSVSLSGALTTGTKHRVGGIYKSSTGTLDLISDGNINSDGTNFTLAGGGSAIGNRPSKSAFMDGIMDNFVVYDRALNATEVQADFDNQPWTP